MGKCLQEVFATIHEVLREESQEKGTLMGEKKGGGKV